MQITKRLHHLTIATGIAFVLLAGSAMAQSVPTSEHNARWPREPAGGPLPATTPAPVADEGNDWTLVSVAAGLVLIAVCAAAATGVRVRVRRRVTA